jgi:hypothetical protein
VGAIIMTDADLIYNALLRAEQRLEDVSRDGSHPVAADVAISAFIALQTLREEIGNALLREGR